MADQGAAVDLDDVLASPLQALGIEVADLIWVAAPHRRREPHLEAAPGLAGLAPGSIPRGGHAEGK